MPSLLDDLWKDVRYALRALSKRRGFALGVVLTLALVIGTNTTMFVALYGVVLRHLPYREPERLVMLWETDPQRGRQLMPVTEGAFPAYQNEVQAFQHTAAFIPPSALLPPFARWGNSQPITVIHCTSQLFQVLQSVPLAGRTFVESDDRLGSPQVAVLSSRMWKEHFGGNMEAIGKPVSLNMFGERRDFTVVGVMPEGFEFPYPLFPEKPDVWLSLPYHGAKFSPGNNFYVLARLQPGASLSQAQTEVDTVAYRLQSEYPRHYASVEAKVVPLQAELTRESGAVLLALFAASAFVLLIGCANVANLLMARAVNREKEMAIRAALGAGRPALLRQLLVEAVLLAVVGGALGLFVAFLCLAALPGLLPPTLYIPRLETVAWNLPAVLFTAAISLIAAIAFGLLPALRFSRPNLSEALTSGSLEPRKPASLLRRPGSLLLVSEVALAVALLAGAALMIQSLMSLTGIQAPFQPQSLLALDVSLSNTVPGDPKFVSNVYRNFLGHARHLPGIGSASLVDRFPLSRTTENIRLHGTGGPAATAFPRAEVHVVTPEYFQILGYSLLRGRWLAETDSPGTEPVALINQSLARLVTNSEPLGLRLTTEFRWGGPSGSTFTVLGILNEPRRFDTGEPAPPAMYLSHYQVPFRSMTVVARTEGDARQSAGHLRQAASAMLPGQVTVHRVRTGEVIVSEAAARSKFTAKQLSLFAALATILAGLGTYSVVSFYTAQRRHEIGVRMALGSTPSRVALLVLRQGMSMVTLGIIIGLAGAAALARTLSSLIYQPRAADLTMFFFAGTFLLLVALVACYFPARRAAMVDPVEVLREQ